MQRATIIPTDQPPEAALGATRAGSDAAARGAIKFLYASGSRPLAGYTIKRGIGRGGFGEVYYAESDGGKEVALKLIRRHLDVELRGIAHCLNLKHPNLLALYDIKQDDEDNTWVVMEYIAGPSLEQVLAAHPHGLAPAEACAWAQGIAAGAGYLHNHGIVHRDLKPGNIFQDEGIIKLGDYGLSKFISCSRRSGHTDSVGTVHYMAPEVANGRYGKQIDIYALGVILYEMLTGRVPFEGESIGEVLMKHLTALPDLSVLNEPYRSIVGRALAKDPEQRFGSIDEMAAALPARAGSPAAMAPPFAMPTAGPAIGTAGGRSTAQQPGAAQQTGTEPPAGTGKSASAADPLSPAINDYWQSAVAWWRRSPRNRVVAIVGLIVLWKAAATLERQPALIESLLLSRLASWACLLAIAYGAYRLVHGSKGRAARVGDNSRPAPVEAPPPAEPASTPAAAPVEAALEHPPHWRRRRWHDLATPALPPKSPRQRLTELLGSLLLSAVASVVISVLVLLCRGQSSQPQQYAWLATMATVGAWSVLLPAKLWEGKRGDAALRRFAMLVVGLGIGTAAFGCQQALLVDLPFDSGFLNRTAMDGTAAFKGWHNLYDSDGSPLAGAFLVYFGLLFLVLRWWRLADPLRKTRLSLWSTGRALLAAYVVNFFWPFPQPWGLILAAAISLSVQLAAPWQLARGESRDEHRATT